MSKIFSRIAGYFSSRTLVGMDKSGNRYFARKEEIDGISQCLALSSSLPFFFPPVMYMSYGFLIAAKKCSNFMHKLFPVVVGDSVSAASVWGGFDGSKGTSFMPNEVTQVLKDSDSVVISPIGYV